MTDGDGLFFSAALYGASLLLILAGYRYSRHILSKPAALLAILSAGFASFLLVRHAPAGPVWTPEPWSGGESTGKPLRLSFPVRQASLLDEARRPALVKPQHIRAPKVTTGAADDEQSGPSGGTGGDSGPAKPGSVLAALLSPQTTRPLRALDIFQECPFCPEMVVVPAGSSVVGATDDDTDATLAEKPQRAVRYWPGFAIGRYEVTIDEYRHFAEATNRAIPACAQSQTGTERMPMTCVTWSEASAYAAWLTRVTGKPYRLPGPAEWEYAARAGRDGGPSSLAAAPAAIAPARVEATAANAWNIHGMAGNVAEIVGGCWQATLNEPVADPERGCPAHMLKDGAWNEPTRWQRPSARREIARSEAQPHLGFRVMRDLR